MSNKIGAIHQRTGRLSSEMGGCWSVGSAGEYSLECNGKVTYNKHEIEALTNVIKHSKARSVFVMLKVNDHQILLTVQDDGLGYQSNEPMAGGRGLLNMQRRANGLGCKVSINSEGGTRIGFTLPLPIKYPAQGME